MEIMGRALDESNQPYKGFKDYYEFIHNMFLNKKNLLCKALKESNLDLKVFEPEGGHFVLADI